MAFLQVCDIHVSICVACIHPMHAFDTCACAHAQGGKARRWEAELERTEKKLRTNLEMLVRTETLQGYTRDRARENDRLTRFSRAEHGCQAFERKTCNLTLNRHLTFSMHLSSDEPVSSSTTSTLASFGTNTFWTRERFPFSEVSPYAHTHHPRNVWRVTSTRDCGLFLPPCFPPQVSIDSLCEALTFDFERSDTGSEDVKPAIDTVRQVSVLSFPCSFCPFN